MKKMTNIEINMGIHSHKLENHIRIVQKVWRRAKKNDEFINSIEATSDLSRILLICDIDRLIHVHDESSFSDIEFDTLADPESSRENVEIANNHHVKVNPHHWQHWIKYQSGKEIAIKMKIKYVIEMLCDWTAKQIERKGNLIVWYDNEKHNMLLHEQTRKQIEEMIPKFELIGKEL